MYSILYPPRILRICIKLHMGYTTIITAYAPTEPRTTTTEAATEAEALYTAKSHCLQSPKEGQSHHCRDFKGCDGTDTEQWSSVIGHFGPREQNTNVIRLLDLCTPSPPPPPPTMACSFQKHGSAQANPSAHLVPKWKQSQARSHVELCYH